jgi:hypothetical protein
MRLGLSGKLIISLRATTVIKWRLLRAAACAVADGCCSALTLRYHCVAQCQQPEELACQLRVGLLGPLQPHQPVIVEVEERLTELVVRLLISHVQLQAAPAAEAEEAGACRRQKPCSSGESQSSWRPRSIYELTHIATTTNNLPHQDIPHAGAPASNLVRASLLVCVDSKSIASAKTIKATALTALRCCARSPSHPRRTPRRLWST